MRNTLVKAIILAAVSSLLFACGGGDPMGKAFDHQEQMLKILESNKDNPDKAGDALEKYVKDNEASFKAIKAEGEKMKDMSEEDLGKMMLKYADRMKAMMEKTQKLAEANPELMKNKKVQKAMSALGGM